MNKDILLTEINYKAVRSSGAGGQNVNKVSSKVVLSFDLDNSNGLNENEKNYLKEKLASRLTQDFILILNCDEDRSQVKNKSIVTKRFIGILEKGLTKPKIRRATKATRASKERRLKTKKTTSITKQNRKKPEL
ncbi:alternative ribosome rescue aminoacyl-tRNA hydrolase ArfB [uncultured Flavobacterium sp.]|uniref:alternative ribosome rescue aminoacyl-tRNA hydrolase ArfB n=1 Tax=uncultured Flavobacterium sp. TaxID=165435 RepID=UPI0030EB7A04|tara:strand:+ start:16965 stop:17366 length:402 start_codon:yes stop_codon:yes gene_type:complete